MQLLTWGTGGPLMYAVLALALVALPFLGLTLLWLRDNPVLPLNWQYEENYRRAYPRRHTPRNDFSVLAASATSATAIIPMATSAQIERIRALEAAVWGGLPSVRS